MTSDCAKAASVPPKIASQGKMVRRLPWENPNIVCIRTAHITRELSHGRYGANNLSLAFPGRIPARRMREGAAWEANSIDKTGGLIAYSRRMALRLVGRA